MQNHERHDVSAIKNKLQRSRPEAPATLAPLKQPSEQTRHQPDTRHRLRNALPGSNNHQNHRDKQHRTTRQAAKDTVQSALELRPPINFDHLLRRDRRTPVPSRRSSDNNAQGDGELIKLQQQTRALLKSVGAEDVNKFKEQNEQREKELRSALERVEEQGMQSTRELDNTYYILLEKAEALRDIVSNMQKLARESRRLREEFNTQSEALQTDVDSTIEEYDWFQEHEQSIKSLLEKLDTYKKRTSTLNDRLENAKSRAEVCEKRIIKAQSQRKKRWNITWAVMLAIVVLVLALLLAKQHPEAKPLVKNVSKAVDAAADVVSPVLARLKTKPSEDPYLHNLFEGIS